MSASPLPEPGREPNGIGDGPSIGRHRFSRWSAIAGRTVYFGHRSVGDGVVAGVEGLTKEHSVPLRIIQTREPAAVSGPAFVHFIAGQSRDYASKNAAVLRLLESRTRAKKPVVVLKYCYGDIDRGADPTTMFDAYCDMVDTIQSEHPDVTVVHTTLPLTTVRRAFNWGARQLFGRRTRRGAAVERHRYNGLLRAEFGAIEPIFDLARVESTRRNGQMSGFTAGGCAIETLAPENTYDGAHLNARCARMAAETLLDVLSDVIETRS